VFFSRSRKWKKVGDAVLANVHPLVLLMERQTGRKISVLRDDNYFLGFVLGMTGLCMQRAQHELGVTLDQEDKGTIIFLVIDQIYGKGIVEQKRQGDLMLGIPKKDPVFVRGYENAAKIYFLLYGKHKLQDDPDYKEALAAVQAGAKMNRSGTDDENVATLLMQKYILEPAVKALGRT
jgi:hypothetical protein